MRLPVSQFVLVLALLVLRAGASPLLDQAAAKWMTERDHWAFTMVVREYEGDALKEERQERFDPSQPAAGRWQLLTVDGKEPTAERRAAWLKKKTKGHRRAPRPLADYFDFERAQALDRAGELIRYRLPLRSNSALIFPVERIALIVTIDRTNRAVEKLEARIDEPYRVALGMARVLDVDLALQMNPMRPGRESGDPSAAHPDGTARLVMNRLGHRIEYAWSGFKRVSPHPDAPSAGELEEDDEPGA